MTCYGKDNLPNAEWRTYVRIAPTRAVRMDRPFKVWTPEGMAYCQDGWLALDPHGNPYAIEAAEFERKWRPSSDVFSVEPLECEDPDHSGDCEVCMPVHPKQRQSTSTALRRS